MKYHLTLEVDFDPSVFKCLECAKHKIFETLFFIILDRFLGSKIVRFDLEEI
jgi:hypothetical protein